MSRAGIEPDPHYRQVSTYEYGNLRDIRLHCILSESILWSYEIDNIYGGKQVVGGFSGPFEALAAALHYGREMNSQEVPS